jgi:hypothetical protein
MWTCDATVVEVTPISRSTGEKPVSLTPISTGQWNSYDIPLTDFTGVSMADIFQLKFDGQKERLPQKSLLIISTSIKQEEAVQAQQRQLQLHRQEMQPM